jgi:hypothetical protein
MVSMDVPQQIGHNYEAELAKEVERLRREVASLEAQYGPQDENDDQLDGYTRFNNANTLQVDTVPSLNERYVDCLSGSRPNCVQGGVC